MRLQRFRRTLLFFSFMLFSFTFMYLSPYLAVLGTFHRTVSGGLLFWGLVLVTSPLLGRSACGYLCPLGGLQESLHGGMDRPLREIKYLKIVKYLIWAAWVGAIAAAAIASGGWGKIHVRFMNGNGLPPYSAEAYIIMLGFMLLAALPAMLIGRRGFCHYLCFFSPLNIVGAWIGRLLRLPTLRVSTLSQGKCKECHLCERSCPMSLPVRTMVGSGAINHHECIACGSCSAACKSGVLGYGFRTPQQAGADSRLDGKG